MGDTSDQYYRALTFRELDGVIGMLREQVADHGEKMLEHPDDEFFATCVRLGLQQLRMAEGARASYAASLPLPLGCRR